MNAPKSIVVIGGGVAGCSVAIHLARLGHSITLAERAAFPRHKVCGCCLGPVGIAEFNQLGVLEQIRSEATKLNHWLGLFDGRSVDLPLDDYIAIARTQLDPLLLSVARSAGVEIASETTAKLVAENLKEVIVSLTCEANENERSFDLCIVAAGLKSGDMGGRLPWSDRPSGPFGVFSLAQSDSLEPNKLIMVCDDDGYTGIVRLPDGNVDVAAALVSGKRSSDSRSPIQRVQRMIDRSGLEIDLTWMGQPMTTPPLRRRRIAGSGRIIAIGDAAGYVEPFTGEGMTWAMQQAREASEFLTNQSGDFATVGDRWNRHARKLLAIEKSKCRALTTALRSKWIRTVAARTLARFPSLAKPLTSQRA